MRSKLPLLIATSAALLAACGTMFAHHGWGVSFDTSKMMTAEATVTEFQWRNPHVYVMYDVEDAQGNVVNWGAETHSPIVCEHQDGWTRSTLKPGDKITISFFPSRVGTPRALLAKIVLNGKVIIDDTTPG